MTYPTFGPRLALGASGLALMALVGAAPALAQDATQRAADRQDSLSNDVTDEIVTVGTRRTQRFAVDTPAPIDVITAEEFTRNASTDVQDLLRTAVPSFNVSTQPISDDASIIRPANLRGLSPDQTLVLVNGKRRHRSSVITFFGGGISDGAQPVDTAAIPAIALKQVEVLRDGASSQYGSDAIAGVINFVLKDAPEGGVFEAQYGSTYAGDGDEWRVSGNIGLPLNFGTGPGGFINLSAEFGETDATDRSSVRLDTQGFIEAGNAAAGDFDAITGGFNDRVPQYWGRSDVDDDLKLFANLAVPVGEAELYAFANFSSRSVANGFFYRAPTNFFSIYEGPSVDPLTGALSTAADAVGSLQVGDLDGIGIGGACPAGIPLTLGDGGAADPAIAAQVAADPNCFSLAEAFPGGFTPRFGGDNEDAGFAVGLRGVADFGAGVAYDLSLTHGTNETQFFLLNSINPSLGSSSPRDFRPGGQRQTETVFNADFAYLVDAGLASDLSIAFGAEYREEVFRLKQGDSASFAVGPLADQGFLTGASGFTGIRDDLRASQDSVAVYTELEADVTERLTLQGALRFEDYGSAGDTLDYKIGGLFRVSDDVRLRATHSTAFHAPTAGQINTQRITTAIDDGLPVDEATVSLQSAPGQLAADFVQARDGGRPGLRPEEAQTFTLGVAFDLGPTRWTVDAYQIDVDDRLGLSEDIAFSDILDFAAAGAGVTLGADQTAGQSLAQLDAAGALDAGDFVGFENLVNLSYITNGADTRTRGVDVVGRMPFDLLGGLSELTLAANYNETDVRDRGTVNPIDDSRVASLEDLLPNWKGFATWTHAQGRWSGLVRANYFGAWDETVFEITPTRREGAEILFDAELAYEVTEGVQLAIGANNVFDNFPDARNVDTEFLPVLFGQKYPDFSPSGFVGGQYYTRLRVIF